jgi:DNA-binding transcriptional LysR family regulator
VDLALVFNPPEGAGLRVERTMVFQLGAVVAPGHPLADLGEVSFAECVDHGLLLPDETLAYRAVIETLWARTMGGRVRGGECQFDPPAQGAGHGGAGWRC